MGKRPLSLTIIMWFLVVMALLALYGVVMMGSNPQMQAMIEKSGVPLWFQQLWGVLGVVITLAVAYGIWKGLPWSRVLYVTWGIIGLVAGFFMSPSPMVLMLSLLFLVVISAFLFGNRGNEWFSARGLALTRED